MDFIFVAVMGIGTAFMLAWEVRRLRKKQTPEQDVFPSAIAYTASMLLMIGSMIAMQALLGLFGYPYVGILIGALPFFWLNPRLRTFIERRLRPANSVDS